MFDTASASNGVKLALLEGQLLTREISGTCPFWVDAVSLFPRADSWYFGVNIPAKPREMLSFRGGLPAYMAKCRESAERGYEGFAEFRLSSTPLPVP